MIKLQNKKDCCGCYACMNSCPLACIEMQEDAEGFAYPVVNEERCISCGLCEKVCPVLNNLQPRKPLYVYAVKAKSQKIRKNSSSGGVFSLLAEQVIQKGGIVFGACFDENNKVVHRYTRTKEGLEAFRGSKYVQSEIGSAYKIVEDFLKSDQVVLFSGTPCQIRGLHLFLKKFYPNLLTVDIICHGVPSPKVWNAYLTQVSKGMSQYKIENINFRDKQYGWRNFGFSLNYVKDKHVIHLIEPKYLNYYMRGFLSDIFLRPSCYQCPVRSLKSGSDITLGDYWGGAGDLLDFFDDKGVSAVLLNTQSGVDYFNILDAEKRDSSYKDVLAGNQSLEQSHSEPEKRTLFYASFEHECFYSLIDRLIRLSFKERIKLFILNFRMRINKLNK
ncbi:Coenzyme F420 hydrogenase/dehydrogenase, beta subunit C-terminal domain [uncultured Parabacteroides sp.]|uniref:Coenzyme F420 hydrogenase/dehydrogenase, beta subunit C-terminal domain n=1 Tax=uncultured Parabacteroides sp. TaxID=512312 RepID=UPI00259BA4D3|nr:Coenzyme F420 hydrogenase/dehydrogenase, beta subunit C-terminal domain [uncultured Parabacteroides sp.]